MFTHENKIQTRVSAELKKDKVLIPSNVLQITWELPHRVPEVVPQYYNEYMIYLTGLLIKHRATVLSCVTLLNLSGRRHFAETQNKPASYYLPSWLDESKSEDREMDLSPKAEETNRLREIKSGAM